MRRTGGQAELSPATLAALARYDWPGNVRELQNTLAALAVHAPPRGRVAPSRLPAAIAGTGLHAHGEPLTLAEARRRFEERFVRATLARAGGHRTDAASSLGLSRQGLAKIIARLGSAGRTVCRTQPMKPVLLDLVLQCDQDRMAGVAVQATRDRGPGRVDVACGEFRLGEPGEKPGGRRRARRPLPRPCGCGRVAEAGG